MQSADIVSGGLTSSHSAMDCHNAHCSAAFIALMQEAATAVHTALTCACHLQRALVHFDAAQIELATQQLEQEFSTLADLDSRCKALLTAWLGISEEHGRHLTMQQLLQHLQAPERSVLEAICDQLSAELSELKRTLSLNRVLALRGRNSIRTTLELAQQANLHALNAAL